MKLIDLLVQELPKRGGWPDGVKAIEQSVRGYLFDSLHPTAPFLFDCHGFELTDEWRTEIVTREQYEAALAASKKVEWDGEGLPPVGCECQIIIGKNGDLGACEVIFMGSQIVVWRQKSTFAEGSSIMRSVTFRPIRSEVDKKREDIAKSLVKFLDTETEMDNIFSVKDVIGFYDAIAAGEIPHIRIE